MLISDIVQIQNQAGFNVLQQVLTLLRLGSSVLIHHDHDVLSTVEVAANSEVVRRRRQGGVSSHN